MCELSIVMPCLNEAETLESCIRCANNFMEDRGIDGEVVVGDNGSSDGSPEIAKRNGARVVNVSIRGYGAALNAAILASRGRYVIMGDSDGSYDFSALEPFLGELRSGCDLVMGDRFSGGIEPGAMPWKNRYVGNPLLTGIGRFLFGCPSRDFHCGLRGFRRDSYIRLDMRTTGMEFASEMVIKATLLGMKIAEVPTALNRDGRSHPPHLRPWRDGWRHLVFMLLYSPRWLFFLPGVALMLVGSLLMAWLLGGPRRLGNAILDIHSILYGAAMILVGFQSVAFAVFSKVFAIQEGLLPEDYRLSKMLRHATLEMGVAVGLLFLAGGVGGTAWAIWDWGRHDFGGLEPRSTMRVAIPSMIAVCLGIQVIFSSFFLCMLGLKTRRLPRPEPSDPESELPTPRPKVATANAPTNSVSPGDTSERWPDPLAPISTTAASAGMESGRPKRFHCKDLRV
jgi:glycosyltransferase involved in cell wall biosynthesis